ncbi:ABC transporter ATP-binding protein [Microlunatus flavus]|uniref:ABC transporter ATP-binding protein n=1 Tax=Microlunatus flavus TaxID=1036181 RepID=UPI0014801E7B|nr:ABC transporter ATP-binding protein [Microlunatus flavus]
MSTSSLLRLVAEPARTHRRALAVSCALSVLQVGAELARPWPLALAVDWAIDRDGVPDALAAVPPALLLVAAGSATLVTSGVVSLLDLGATRTAERTAERLGADLRRTVFAHSLRLSLRWHAGTRSAELVSRLTSDVGRVLDAVTATTLTLVPDALMLVGVVVVLLVLDPWLALLGLLVVPVLAALSLRQRRHVRASQGVARAAGGRLSTTAADLLRNVGAVQAFGRLDRAVAEFGTANAEVLRTSSTAVDVETRWTPYADVVLALGAALVLVAGGLQVGAGTLTTGGLLVVLGYLRDLYSPVRALTRLSGVWARAGASAERVADVLDAEPEGPDAPGATAAPPLRGTVELRGVTFGYEPGRPVLRDLDLVLRPGETVCLFGPSGAGKSTVLLLLLRLWDPDAGTLRHDGVDLRRFTRQSVRERIAYVPQDPWLLDATLAQNVAFGSRDATRAQVLEACARTHVDEFVDRLPLRHDTPLGEGGARLSGGQRRRVALARAAVSPADLVLLDEPTASLDAVSAAHVVEAVRAATTRRTTLLVTHDPALAQLADRVVHVIPSSAAPTGAAARPETRKEVEPA